MALTPREQFDAALDPALGALGLTVDARRRDRFFAHYEQVVEANRHFNLTRITSPAEAALKHYADSLALLAAGWVEPARRLAMLDVGTGAGFPAVPLGIVCDAWSITAIDGTGKKARFVESSVEALGLTNVTARHDRVEDMARQGGHKFDFVVLRAVAKIGEVLEDLAAVMRRGGSIVFYKTGQVDPELAAAAPLAAKLRLHMDIRDLSLPGTGESIARKLIRFR